MGVPTRPQGPFHQGAERFKTLRVIATYRIRVLLYFAKPNWHPLFTITPR
jgi:hypothetical protein